MVIYIKIRPIQNDKEKKKKMKIIFTNSSEIY